MRMSDWSSDVCSSDLAITLLIDKCLIDLEANAEACQANLEAGTALATYLVPTIGYARAAEIAKRALRDGGSLRDAALLLEPSIVPILDTALRRGAASIGAA